MTTPTPVGSIMFAPSPATGHLQSRISQLERDLAAAQEANEQLRKERDAAFAMTRCECQSDECCRNLVEAQEALKAAERKAEEAARDAGRYRWIRCNGVAAFDDICDLVYEDNKYFPSIRKAGFSAVDAAIDAAIAARGEA